MKILDQINKLEWRAQQAFLRELTVGRRKELKSFTKKLTTELADELETLRGQAHEEVKSYVQRTQEWHRTIRHHLNQPEGRQRLPGLLPPFPGSEPEWGRWAPDLTIELTSCFLDSSDAEFTVPFDSFDVAFSPDTGGTALAEDAGVVAANIHRSAFQYITGAAEAETVQGELTIRHTRAFSSNNFVTAGRLFRRDALIVEPLALMVLQGLAVGPNILELVDEGGGGGPLNPPSIDLTCTFKTKIEQEINVNERLLLDHAEVVVYNGLVPLNGLGLELPFGFNAGLSGVVLRGDLRPDTIWHLTVDLVIETVAVGGTVQLTLDKLFSQLQVLPPVVSKENCTTRRVNMWDVRLLEEALHPVIGGVPATDWGRPFGDLGEGFKGHR
jgi:hypothetical protein